MPCAPAPVRPRVSVVLAAYNAGAFIDASICSILTQTFTNFELIVVNDASTDGTLALLQSYTDKRLKIIDLKQNVGAAEAINQGVKHACGEYLARMDADDLCHPERLAKQVAYLDAHPNVGVVGTRYHKLFESGRTRKALTPTDDATLQFRALWELPFCHPTLMFRKCVLDDLKLSCNAADGPAFDVIFVQKLLGHTTFACLPDYLFTYRVHSGGLSKRAKGDKIPRLAEAAVATVARVLGWHGQQLETLHTAITLYHRGEDKDTPEHAEMVFNTLKQLAADCVKNNPTGLAAVRQNLDETFLKMLLALKLRGLILATRHPWQSVRSIMQLPRLLAIWMS